MNSLNIDNTSSTLPAVGAAQQGASSQSTSELSQSDFIELLVAQIANQDPSKPMDPSQFMDQLAQFSMVTGIEELNTSFNSLADKLAADQSLQAANLVGHEVLVPGGFGLLDESGGISGQLYLPQRSSEVTLRIYNEQGVEVRELPMGGHDKGAVEFKWDGFADDGSAAAQGDYIVVAEAMIDGELQAVEVSLQKRVDSVTLSQNGAENMLNLDTGESVPLNIVQQIM